MKGQYRTLTGRRFDIEHLTEEERTFLDDLTTLYRTRPDWNEFAQKWIKLAREKLWKGQRVPVGAPVYRICQDMEARLGVAEGRVAAPDYRDRIADLIEVRFGSRYAFCKETGLDQGNLSRVLGGTRHLSPEALVKVLRHLDVEIELVEKADVFEAALESITPSRPEARLATLQHHIATLRNLVAMAKDYPPEAQSELLRDEGLFDDGLETLRLRVRAGMPLEEAANAELKKALDEKVALTRQVASKAEEERDSHNKKVI